MPRRKWLALARCTRPLAQALRSQLALERCTLHPERRDHQLWSESSGTSSGVSVLDAPDRIFEPRPGAWLWLRQNGQLLKSNSICRRRRPVARTVQRARDRKHRYLGEGVDGFAASQGHELFCECQF